MLTIWGRANSNNVKKALWCLEELGLAYRHIPAGGAFGVTDSADYRAMNPNGLVPTIDDDGLVLWESNAIVRYLGARYGEGRIYVTDPGKRAIGDRWMDWATSALSASISPMVMGLLRTPPEKRDHATIEAAHERAARLLAIPDKALAETPYLSGEEFAMGDIPLGPFIYTWYNLPIERPDLPNLAAWYERMAARAAFRKAVMIPLS